MDVVSRKNNWPITVDYSLQIRVWLVNFLRLTTPIVGLRNRVLYSFVYVYSIVDLNIVLIQTMCELIVARFYIISS